MTNMDYHNSCYDLPLFTGEVLRDEGIAKVTDHNSKWMELALREAQTFVSYSSYLDTFTGEDIRHRVSYVVGCPHHPNAYGALISTLIKRDIIVPTGEYRKMRDETSHARKTPVYKKA